MIFEIGRATEPRSFSPGTSRPSPRSDLATSVLAELLFHFPSPPPYAAAPLPSLTELFRSLPSGEQSSLRVHWGSANLEALFNLSSETDPELFFEGLLNWARAQERSEHPKFALLVYRLMHRITEVPESLRSQATEHLAVLNGSGSWGQRAEHFLDQTRREVLSPANLAAMAGAGFAFRASRLGFLRLFSEWGLARAPLNVAAAAAAFNVEAWSFPVLHRLSHRLAGDKVDWSREGLRRDILSSYLFLGGMRLAGFASSKFLQWGSRAPGANRLLAPNLGILPPLQNSARWAGMFGGVMGGSYLESLAGLRHFDSASDFFQHSLSTFLQFQLAGRVLQQTLGPRFAHVERRMDLMAANWSSVPRTFSLGALAMAGGGPGSGSPIGTPWLAMSQNNGVEVMIRPEPVLSPPGGLRLPTKPVAEPAPVQVIPVVDPQLEVIDALVRHRGNFKGAAESLGVSAREFERRMEAENYHSELSVFQTQFRGRMLFYRPALATAHSLLGTSIYQPRSLQELQLSPEALSFVQRVGVHSLWDLLLVNRSDLRAARHPNEAPSLVEAHLSELQLKVNQRLANEHGRVFENYPFEEGMVKTAMGRVFQDRLISDLGLAPDIERPLHGAGLWTVGELMRQPIPTWIPRDALLPGAPLGAREAMVDQVIRGLFAMLHGVGPRRYRPPTPED